MKTALKNTLLGILVIYATFSLSGCAVAIVGAIGAAGISNIDKKDVEPAAANNRLLIKNQEDEAVLSKAVKQPVAEVFTEHKAELALRKPQDSSEDIVIADKSTPVVTEQQSAQHPNTELTPHIIINNTSLDKLSSHAWKLIAVRGIKDFNIKRSESIFMFSRDFQLRAFVTCNNLVGKYEANDAGRFLLSKLKSTNKTCSASREQEVLIESMLLSANEFFIDDQILTLGFQGKANLAFEAKLSHAEIKRIKKPIQRKDENRN